MLKTIYSYLAISISCILLLSIACSDDIHKEPTNYDELIDYLAITSVEPSQGGHGAEVLISGHNFSVNASEIKVSINGINIPVLRANEEQILVKIPKDKNIGTAPIELVVGGEKITNTKTFTYLRTRTVSTLAGTGERGYKDGAGNQAQFSFTTDWGETRRGGIDVDDNFNVYVSDAANQCIRKIAPDGTVTTVAGQGPDVPITDWGINWRLENEGKGSYNAQTRPTDVKVDSKGNMYVTDDYIGGMIMFEPDGKAHYLGYGGGVNCIAIDEKNNTLYLNNHNEGNIYTKAMDNYGPSPSAMQQIISGVQWSAGMAVDKRNSDLYLVYHDENKILRYRKGEWNSPTTVAGSGTEGNMDGTAQSARFYSPWGIAIDAEGNLYVGGNGSGTASIDAKDQSVRFIHNETGYVTSFAGSSNSGYTNGDFFITSYGGLDNSVQLVAPPIRFKAPTGVAVDKEGTVYVLDRGNNVVRKIVTE